MQVKPSTNNMYSIPNFQAVSIVQIPKSAFSSSNVRACQKEFTHALNSATSDKMRGILGAIVSLFTTKLHKTANIFESFSNYISRCVLHEQNIDYSLTWLKLNTGLPIREKLNENYHSFYVFTKEHKSASMNAMKMALKNTIKYAQEGLSKYSTDKKMAKIYSQVKFACEADDLLEAELKDVPIQKFKISNLDELKNIVPMLDI